MEITIQNWHSFRACLAQFSWVDYWFLYFLNWFICSPETLLHSSIWIRRILLTVHSSFSHCISTRAIRELISVRVMLCNAVCARLYRCDREIARPSAPESNVQRTSNWSRASRLVSRLALTSASKLHLFGRWEFQFFAFLSLTFHVRTYHS